MPAPACCLQCAHFHPVDAFDEGRRSCRHSLERHRQRRRELLLRRQKEQQQAEKEQQEEPQQRVAPKEQRPSKVGQTRQHHKPAAQQQQAPAPASQKRQPAAATAAATISQAASLPAAACLAPPAAAPLAVPPRGLSGQAPGSWQLAAACDFWSPAPLPPPPPLPQPGLHLAWAAQGAVQTHHLHSPTAASTDVPSTADIFGAESGLGLLDDPCTCPPGAAQWHAHADAALWRVPPLLAAALPPVPPGLPGPGITCSMKAEASTASGGSSETGVDDGSSAGATGQPLGALDRFSCRVPGCSRELKVGFLQRCRCCEFHSREPQLELHGVTSRFCQQCGFFHALEEFDAQRRSCRRSLERHRVCRRLRRQRAAEQKAREAAAGTVGDAACQAEGEDQSGESLPTPQLEEEVPAAAKGRSKRSRRKGPAVVAAAVAAAQRAAAQDQPQAQPRRHSPQLSAGAEDSTMQVPQVQAEPAQQQQGSGSQRGSRKRWSAALAASPAASPPDVATLPLLAPPCALPSETPSVATVDGPEAEEAWQLGCGQAAAAAAAAAAQLGPDAALPPPHWAARALAAADVAQQAAPAAAQPCLPPPAPGARLPALLFSDPWVTCALPPPPPLPLVEEAMAILRAPTPVFNDVPSHAEMLEINAELGLLDIIGHPPHPGHSATGATPAWLRLHWALQQQQQEREQRAVWLTAQQH
ncbi:hypothetical protein CHLNCDRAFT_136317 [Chlorella variabilis]|uniref:SBP-type domain-containing protein n=1 Tax=Chlorella variabilis TaxID=554065 RepID=E1ZK36_CHLVA|nr:hypothetical protein CHLNCDRAFT_136317 [Chlorella variabilis]EFN53735.1 hypothetical protein CHLNCDRAFT_136317 [Chlorella variabilis]|eukprot:XP_005845837.1 hypothetical protein CHLNCDRAFT_136317 [Chlorella variabilis]